MALQKRNAAHINLQQSDLSRNAGELHLSSEAAVLPVHLACAYTVILATGGVPGIVVALPLAADVYGKTYAIKKVDAGIGPVLVTPTPPDTIDGAPVWPLVAQWDAIIIVSDGATSWYVISQV